MPRKKTQWKKADLEAFVIAAEAAFKEAECTWDDRSCSGAWRALRQARIKLNLDKGGK